MGKETRVYIIDLNNDTTKVGTDVIKMADGGYMAKGGAIKDWEDKMKGRKDIEFLRIERKEKLPNGNLMIYYKYNTLNEFDTTKVGTDVIKAKTINND